MGKNGSSEFFLKHFNQTLLLEALLPSGGGVTQRVKKQDSEWIVVTVLGCGLKKHTQSPIRPGEHETNFQFSWPFWLSSGTKTEEGGGLEDK